VEPLRESPLLQIDPFEAVYVVVSLQVEPLKVKPLGQEYPEEPAVPVVVAVWVHV
jgi:hypothetical protein